VKDKFEAPNGTVGHANVQIGDSVVECSEAHLISTKKRLHCLDVEPRLGCDSVGFSYLPCLAMLPAAGDCTYTCIDNLK
jgi:hypothetical protein